MSKTRIWAVILLLISGAVGYFVYGSQFTNVPYVAHVPFRLGLDLNGGTHLMYRADTTQVAEGEVDGAMNSLREVIERRVNLFGVSEPLVQVVQGGNEQRLIVELPGVTDVGEAIRLIGKTPSLEFKLATTTEVGTSTVASLIETGFDGKYIEKAQLVFDPNSNEHYLLISQQIILVVFWLSLLMTNRSHFLLSDKKSETDKLRSVEALRSKKHDNSCEI
jgi:preprotein translocase subunit SecD